MNATHSLPRFVRQVPLAALIAASVPAAAFAAPPAPGTVVAVVDFANDADARFGDVGRAAAQAVRDAWPTLPGVRPAVLVPGPSATANARKRTTPEQQRADAIERGRGAGAALVIFGRVLEVELGTAAESQHSGSHSVIRQLEAPSQQKLTCRYTIHERRHPVRIRVRYEIARCPDGRILLTNELTREVPWSVGWLDVGGDASACPSDLMGIPRTAPPLRPEDGARTACQALGPAIASGAAQELTASR